LNRPDCDTQPAWIFKVSEHPNVPLNPPMSRVPGLIYRRDIDALRAIAVLAVIAFHAAPHWVPGGFTGVDVFFVISGYLISTLILHELSHGSFRFLNFYDRRIRRLFPALITVLLATFALGWFLLIPTDFAALGRHIVAAAAFSANILNYMEAGYFDAPAATKPLLHIWSLGVEEQFYFVFPALLVVVTAFRVVWALAIVAVASFALNIWLRYIDPSFTFFLPFTRLWEFMPGAVLAYVHWQTQQNEPARASRIFREVIPALGFALIAAGIVLSSRNGYPGWLALLPVTGTFFVIGAEPDAWFNRTILSARPLILIGLISYPLYLWHWPLLVIARIVMRDQGNHHHETAIIATVVALSFVLAGLTYRFIELPIRFRTAMAPRIVSFAVVLSLGLVGLLGLGTNLTLGFFWHYPKEVQALGGPIKSGGAASRADATGPLVIAFGDSHAAHLIPGLHALQAHRNFRYGIVSWQCAPWGALPWNTSNPTVLEKCRTSTIENEATLTKLKPDIVLMAAFWYQYAHLERIRETIQLLKKVGTKRIIVIGVLPFYKNAPQKSLYSWYLANPRAAIPTHLKIPEMLYRNPSVGSPSDIDRTLAAAAASEGVSFISAMNALCTQTECIVRVGDTSDDFVEFDSGHLSASGSEYFMRRIEGQIFDEDSESLLPSTANRGASLSHPR
jgi:peptidoglycan/LPS O-acetylase OafA/YrhL